MSKTKKKKDSTLALIEKIVKDETGTLKNEEQLLNYNKDNDKSILIMLLTREMMETKLRGKLTQWLIIIMAIQILVINIVVILMGCDIISFRESMEPLRWLFTFVISEVIGFITLIVKYLFKNDTTHTLNLISKYIDRLQPGSSQVGQNKEVVIDFGS